MNKYHNTVVIYSGGMDSFTLAAMTRAEGSLHSCLSFNYGQLHQKELEYARTMCADWMVPHHLIDLSALAPHLQTSGSALMGAAPMPEGHYAEPSMKQTVVPNRNMTMLAVAVAYAISHRLDKVRYGAHAGDHTIYPDCRPEFVFAMNQATEIADWHPIKIEAPFQFYTKTDILRLGLTTLKLDYGRSWTCYNGRTLACGRCGSCQERLEAFKAIGQRDPLEYEIDDPAFVEGE